MNTHFYETEQKLQDDILDIVPGYKRYLSVRVEDTFSIGHIRA